MKINVSCIVLLLLSTAMCYPQGTWTNFDTTSGLPTIHAYDIEVDKFDNIWVILGGGTFGDGLAKFDGFNWTNIDTSNSNLPHNALAVTQSDKAGVLWMGFQGGTSAYLPGLTSFNGQSFTSYDTINSTILSNGLWDIQTDKENNIWVGCINGFSKFDGQSFTNYLVDFPNSFGGVPDLLYKIPLVFGFLHLVASYTITLSPIPQRFTT